MENLHVTAGANALINRASELIPLGRIGAGRPVLAVARALAAPSEGLTLIGARLALASGASAQALEEMDHGIAATPAHVGLRQCRADIRRRIGDLGGAACDAAEAIILDPADSEAKAILGAVMLELQRPAEAADCMAEALTGAPSNLDFRHALATAIERSGDLDGSQTILIGGIAISPTNVAIRNKTILFCMRRRDFRLGIRLGQEACSLGIADFGIFGLLGHVLSSLGQHDQAAIAYQDALKLSPEDALVGHLVMASDSTTESLRASENYLRTVFDDYADRFEVHLNQLSYRIPGGIRMIVYSNPKIVADETVGAVLDLGCGTGLIAVAIEGLPLGPFTGVDLSPQMLDDARAKCLYKTLRQGVIVSDLTLYEQRWPLIIAADVFCFFGALEDLLALVYQRLKPSGWLLFAVESLQPDYHRVVPGNWNWALQRRGRYAHAEHYVYEASCNAGFRIERIDRPTIRQEASADVTGLLLVLERVRHDR